MEGEINRQRNLPYEKVASVIVDSNVIDDGQREKNLYVLSLIEGLQRLHLRRRSHVYINTMGSHDQTLVLLSKPECTFYGLSLTSRFTYQ